ncbi:hypothetical protein [Bacillus dicomae]|uniref:Uncharacterized protein n=1 Tax=Bacillus dicomae TaxID=3088378 RepID=A0AC61T7E7_9BACI|nr:hypothetical protein [Bacillus dicomae]TPV44564.1 hypothetical protein FJ659_15310 [Bacillus dicomae]
MKFDLTIPATVISTVTLFLILHYIIEPRKERKKKREERFKTLYAPLYTMIIAKLYDSKPIMKHHNCTDMMFWSKEKPKYLNDVYLIEFVLNNSAYASRDLLNAVHKYVEALAIEEIHKTIVGYESVDNLVKVVVKEYNQLKKERGEEFIQTELETGIPEFILKMREAEKVAEL